ncbi:divisome protein SepX/GlpR [Actinokineospora pegani]|uniref:divisome protein SepX/GlpR n=1 Tax=Actinokineospora pegani TaxID=2654637 RepID=UPI0012EA10ED|nr:gephyrin-like molybdotransferase receptor GlpR [Actinokineospora pegani]
MPTSLIVVALVVAWLVVLVPMVVRKRQEIARTADSTLASRVVRSGSAVDAAPETDSTREDLAVERTMDRIEPEEDGFTYTDDFAEDPEEFAESRRHRPGRGGFDPDAAARAAKAKYSFRQRVVLFTILAALVTLVAALVASPVLWIAHGAVDLAFIGYLTYLRRQVRIEEEVRQRRYARMVAAVAVRRSHAHPVEPDLDDTEDIDDVDLEYEEPRRTPVKAVPRLVHPGANAVDLDDEDPWFDELGDPGLLPYRRAVGE